MYTRKVHTDVAYIACARKLLAAPAAIYPQFATHNAQTLATIHELAGPDYEPGDYEFQCLHGMGEPLYEEVVARLAYPSARAVSEYSRFPGLNFSATLPGPVGERNVYELRSRGHILLKPVTLEGAVQQLGAALASGNSAVVEGFDFPLDLPPSVQKHIAKDGAKTISAALIEGTRGRVQGILKALACRGDGVVPAQAASSLECSESRPAYCLHWLLTEVSLSADTTAAGGNASLMMLA